MASRQLVKFYKYQGAGNDFVLIEDYDQVFSERMLEHVPFLCHRNFGIGADGLILLQPSRLCTAKKRIFNADGGEAALCGNGLRCAIKHFDTKTVSIETRAGICLGENLRDEVAATLPAMEELLSPLALGDGRVGHLMNTGVPHLIIEVDDLAVENFEEKVRELRYHRMFAPEGTNVSYITRDGMDIQIRTYERGVEAETLACGTACAAAALVVRKFEKKKRSKYTVYPKSGNSLRFMFDTQNRIWMHGPAEMIYQGEISLEMKTSKRAKAGVK